MKRSDTFIVADITREGGRGITVRAIVTWVWLKHDPAPPPRNLPPLRSFLHLHLLPSLFIVAFGDATVETPRGRRGVAEGSDPAVQTRPPREGGGAGPVKVLPQGLLQWERVCAPSFFKGLKTCDTFIELMSMLKSANVE